MKTEVLAPVGNSEMLKAAVRSGADAVYFGAKSFNARRNASNFSHEELKNAIKYCHIFGVKAYLTLNVLLKETELREAFLLAKYAYECGIDALIVADLGLIGILHKKLPDLDLHASTQMTVFSPSALLPLKKMGIKRVVAAREMSKPALSELVTAANSLDMTVEVFVHGALCMSVSGQCLLSAFLGSRSGNRGLCAGPCRLPFKAENGSGYELSLKDLSLINHVKELKEMGVASLKIEGRMKRPEYVAAAVFNIKEALNGTQNEENLNLLNGVFSRSGFTDGYFTGKTGGEMFGIRTKEDVLSGETVFSKIHALYKSEPQNIGVCMTFTAKRDKPSSLKISDGENTVTAVGNIPGVAVKISLTKESAKEQLSKSGGTPYFVNSFSADIDENLYLSISSLNSLRRQAVELLNEKRSSQRTSFAEYSPVKAEKIKRKKQFLLRLNGIEQIPDNLNGVFGISLPIESDISSFESLPVVLFADIPRFFNEKFVKDKLSEFKAKGFKYALCPNLAAAQIAQSSGLKIAFSLGSNIFNSESISLLSGLFNADIFILSPELKVSEIDNISTDKKTGYISYGFLPLMTAVNCPVKNGNDCKNCDKRQYITDRMSIKFPVRCRLGVSEILNSKPLITADKQNDFNTDFSLLYFTDEDKNKVNQILTEYRNGEKPDTDFTRGLYYRGVE